MTEISIDSAKLRADVLNDGHDDYFGLYEIVWSLNRQYPQIARPAKVAAAQGVTRELLASGAIALYRTEWASNNYEPIPTQEALRLIESPVAWDDPTDRPYICYAAA